jgi:1-deoxy-D-xylulose-5-phosphate synthase
MHTLVKPASSFLDAIASPAQLKKLQNSELQTLADEIRQEIIQSLAKTGGHLASNLGIVETTIALHKVFNSPQDLFLWDVGHQAYVHKMLTGRRHRFNTLRQFKGLNGFISPAESEHDAFIAGHSSTSISLAVGMALASDLKQQNRKVVAVIGDGGLTGGMALEAINHLGHIQKDVVIILNDNEMSISENLGGISLYMKRIKETFFYKDIKQKIDIIEDKLDEAMINPALWDLIEMVKKEAKERFDTPGIVFEKLGINYSGPVDGHDVQAVINALAAVKDKNTPQLVHIITQKGKGYAPAEFDSIKYHGVPAFALEAALTEKAEPFAPPLKPKVKTYSDVFSEALIEIAAQDKELVAITPATAEGSGLVKFGKVFPERFFDVAICEQHAVTMAAGMAKLGLKPVVSIYSTFLQRAMDQVVHDVAIMNLPVVFGIDRGGLVEDGETHQGVFDISWLRTVPNMQVWAPRDAHELRNMLYTAIKQSRGPVAIRFPRDKALAAQVVEVDNFTEIDPTKWETLVEGKHLEGRAASYILAYGALVDMALQALPQLHQAGIFPTVINARSAKPLDEKLLKNILSVPGARVVTLEEGMLAGSFGSAVLEYQAQLRFSSKLKVPAEVSVMAIGDRFVEHGARPILLDLVGLSIAKISESLLSYFGQED